MTWAAHLTVAHALSQKDSFQASPPFVHNTVCAGACGLKIDGIYAFTEQTKQSIISRRPIGFYLFLFMFIFYFPLSIIYFPLSRVVLLDFTYSYLSVYFLFPVPSFKLVVAIELTEH